MAKNKYTIKYTETFVNQFNNILKYFIYKLQNKIAAEIRRILSSSRNFDKLI